MLEFLRGRADCSLGEGGFVAGPMEGGAPPVSPSLDETLYMPQMPHGSYGPAYVVNWLLNEVLNFSSLVCTDLETHDVAGRSKKGMYPPCQLATEKIPRAA